MTSSDTATDMEVTLEEFRKRADALAPPSKSKWALWLIGLVVGVVLVVATISLVVATRIDSSQAQTPEQYATLNHDLAQLHTIANKTLNKQSVEYAQLQATYSAIESQIQSLCASVSGCVWHPIPLNS